MFAVTAIIPFAFDCAPPTSPPLTTSSVPNTIASKLAHISNHHEHVFAYTASLIAMKSHQLAAYIQDANCSRKDRIRSTLSCFRHPNYSHHRPIDELVIFFQLLRYVKQVRPMLAFWAFYFQADGIWYSRTIIPSGWDSIFSHNFSHTKIYDDDDWIYVQLQQIRGNASMCVYACYCSRSSFMVFASILSWNVAERTQWYKARTYARNDSRSYHFMIVLLKNSTEYVCARDIYFTRCTRLYCFFQATHNNIVQLSKPTSSLMNKIWIYPVCCPLNTGTSDASNKAWNPVQLSAKKRKHTFGWDAVLWVNFT